MLQLRSLPHNPFHRDFLSGLVELLRGTKEGGDGRGAMYSHRLALGFIRTLLERVLTCGTCVPCFSDAQPGFLMKAVEAPLDAPTEGDQMPDVWVEDVDLWHVLGSIMDTLFASLTAEGPGGQQQQEEDHWLALEQLLSNPAALTVAVHQLLAKGAREAAARGVPDAQEGMRAIRRLFHYVATAVFLPTSAERASCAAALRTKLSALLNLEENLPFLELLCFLDLRKLYGLLECDQLCSCMHARLLAALCCAHVSTLVLVRQQLPLSCCRSACQSPC
jgi:hypothetical protein